MTTAELIRLVRRYATARGMTPALRPADLRAAHDAARTLLRLMGLLAYTEDDPVFVRVEEGR